MFHYLIALRAEGRYLLALDFERLAQAVAREGALEPAVKEDLLVHLETLARESVLPKRSRHRPAMAAAMRAVTAHVARSESLVAQWGRLRARVARAAA